MKNRKGSEIWSENIKVITLCGSTRFKEEFFREQKRLTLEGNIVISVGLFGHSGDDEVWTEGTKEMLDDMHKRKIDMADEIFVINAGSYIIIEREYKVDDIVTIDNFTGVVKEIGLRTTKVLDSNGNLKTFNKSKINGVINLTNNYSKTFITTSISQDYDVSFVEEFINGDLRKRMEGNKKIVNDPWFSGITDIKGGNYTISIGVRCRQQDQWTVRKDVYANLMEVAKEKGVKLL